MRLVLASRSPRRLELLARLGIEPIVDPADIDETPHAGEDPLGYVERMACEKAVVVSTRHSDDVVLAADTTVDIDGRILGQPRNESEARTMLRALSGRTHRVHTAVCLAMGQGHPQTPVAVSVVTSLVTFRPVTDETLEWYIGTGEWHGKAGSYAVQGLGGTLVERVRGSYSNVVGLPLRETAQLLGINGPDLGPDID